MAKQKEIKSRQFEVPKEFIGTFFSELEDTSLDYNIIEYDNDEEELIVEVEYAPDERDEVMNLIELLDDYYSEENETSGEDENQSNKI